MIHSSLIHKLVERGEFSITYIAKDGHLVQSSRVVCTSFHAVGRTMNIKFCDSEEIRTVRRCTITEINGQEVVL
ncbi:hypothetical protein [Mangrovibacterium sp.]|uniref:hypothetical protein n=1 Tax=Mangrovibacterium sp. TaxID=1961364 RepID=UPI003566D876